MCKLVGMLVIISLLVLSCSPTADNTSNTDMPSNGINNNNTNGQVLPTEGQPPDDITWISPGKVVIGTFYPGARAEYPILIHNGNDVSATFTVTYRYPGNTAEGYAKPTEDVQDWVIIADMTPVIAPKQTEEILITLAMPDDAEVFALQWEFWISVIDTTQTGMVRTELCSRWLVNMR